MPIKIQENLPAIQVLESENIFVMTNQRAMTQDIRPLKIIILNLMPTKIDTETQLLRLLSNTPLQIDVELMQMSTHTSKNTPSSHIHTFYKSFAEIKEEKYDGMIITGAPVENMPFEEVDYWDELCEIMSWSRRNVYSTMHICWGAQAGLYFHFGIPKYQLPQKLSGIFSHHVLENHHPLVRGFDDIFYAPHSRNTETRETDIDKHDDLIILTTSDEAGIHIAANKNGRQFFVTGHLEYDQDTLAKEYFRDEKKGLHPLLPKNYFPNDNSALSPPFVWRSHANLLFINWINYYVYQQTPYDLKTLTDK